MGRSCVVCGRTNPKGRMTSSTCSYECKVKRNKRLNRNLELRQRPKRLPGRKVIVGAFKQLFGVDR